MNEIQSASHRVVPEIEHLLKSAVSTNIHDLGSHTVSVTHLDLDQKVGKCYPNYISEFLRGQVVQLMAQFNRDWSPKFETGLNTMIGIVQKV